MKNRKIPQTLYIYKNQKLINELNNMMIRIKAHLFEFNNLKTSDTISTNNFPKPTIKELDELTNKLVTALQESVEPTIKY
jgi:hypothetical protein